MHLDLMLKSRNLNCSVLDGGSLTVQFAIQIAILLSALVISRLLFVNFYSKGLDEAEVCVGPRLVIVLHLTFFFGKVRERLLERLQLVLKCTVVTLSGAEVLSLFAELQDEAVLRIVLTCCLDGGMGRARLN